MDWQNELDDSIEFMDTVKHDLFSSEIYIFTPGGDIKALPFGSTPIDFAYSIHSDVGHHCTGARVNEQMVPLSYKLDSGDEVEIITSPHRYPSKDWLKIAVTSRAKARIRQHLKQEQRKKSINLGKKIFEQECQEFDLNPNRLLKSKSFNSKMNHAGFNDADTLFSNIAFGKVNLKDWIKTLFPDKYQAKEKKPQDGIIKKIFKKVSLKNKKLVTIDGIDDLLVTMAKCCLPIPGDPIIGFVTLGRGVTIHRTNCPKVPDMDPARRVKASWNKVDNDLRTSKLTLTTENKTGMLAQVSQIISKRKVNITKVVVRTTKDEKALMYLDLQIRHIRELHGVMKDIQKIKGVINVERKYLNRNVRNLI
jgi:GTP pyrophosphokinase